MNVQATLAGTPTLIVGGGSDTVYIENSDESLQDILGPVTVTNPPAYSTLVIDDSGDST